MTLAGRVLAGRYRLDTLLAEGGMGAVWSAHHSTLDVPVAVKVMATEALAREGLRVRFEREAKATAQLRTPHVVQVFDYGIDEGTPFLVMELLEGEDFGALGRSRAPFSLAETADLIGQAALGLQAAHQAGIIHRDIKPSNLFLAEVARGQSLVKVLDFGIAKTFVDGGVKFTKTNVVLGSPSYMSPEQVLAQPIDARTDVWSLGVVTFLMLSGELPFRGATPLDVSQKIAKGIRPRFTDAAPGMPAALDAFFDRALATAPTSRHATVASLAEELARIARANPGAIREMQPATPPTPLARIEPAHAPIHLAATRDEREPSPAGSESTSTTEEKSTARAPVTPAAGPVPATMVSAQPAPIAVEPTRLSPKSDYVDGTAAPSRANAPTPPAISPALRTTAPMTQDISAAVAARQRGNTAPMRGAPRPEPAWFQQAQTPVTPERTLEPTAVRRPDSQHGARSAPVLVSAVAVILGVVALTALAARRWASDDSSGSAPSTPAAMSMTESSASSAPPEQPAEPLVTAAPASTETPATTTTSSAIPPVAIPSATGHQQPARPQVAPSPTGTHVASSARTAPPVSSPAQPAAPPPTARSATPLPLGL
jgi:eukaryotic-like serine/threonine-protein kinase